ncbi:MAG: PTS system mannose/fructose/sorbose family transporter subunit IID [Gemmatimonadota bacterium]|nr:MAG: PTS system mannose/fructose/sorbose family transporter subunit IID [Gemmatimonadota bacterium]
MAGLKVVTAVRVLLRSLLIQGSWNYRTMQGAGLGFALVPILRWLYRGDEAGFAAALRRHTQFFNAHPYLSTVAIAALARMEAARASADHIDRFRRALVSPLGSLGDRLVWARWRPLSALAAILLFLMGAPWWVAVTFFLVTYNALHLGLRIWGLRVGWREGPEVGRALVGSPLRRLPDRLTIPLAIVSGALVPPLALAVGSSSGVGPLPILAVALALAAAGAWRPAGARRLAVLGLLVGLLIYITLAASVW